MKGMAKAVARGRGMAMVTAYRKAENGEADKRNSSHVDTIP